MGFSVPPRLRLERWALTPPFHLDHTLARKSDGGQSVFCGTVRRDASRHHLPRVSRHSLPCVSGYRLRGIAPYGVRTFLLPELLRESDPPPFQNRAQDKPFWSSAQAPNKRVCSDQLKPTRSWEQVLCIS